MSSEVEPLIHSCPKCAALLDISEQDPFSEIQCPSCNERMRVRSKFDHFELIEVIASGGMGTVYRARDITLDRIVALKLLRKEFSVDQEYIEKLETEAKITASVNHPHVVKVFSFGCDQGLYYIAMELVDKGSLDDLMTLQKRIAEIQVLEIGIQVAQGLRAAYQAGLIHRDVKPGNILFADAHTAKMVDFGLAMPLEQAKESDEEIWGTPYYVAPEKLNHDPEDFRSDIYSLGGTLFHALAGRPPFEAENASLVALKHLKSQIVSLQAFAPDISSPTAYVINRTLAKNPEDRYQSYDELIEHFEYARAKLLENSGKPRQVKARVVMEGEDQQKALGIITMGVIAAVVVLSGVLFFFWDDIMSRRLSLEDLQREQALKASGSAEEAYRLARKMVGNGAASEALPILWQLEARPNIPQPLKSWIYLQAGLAAFQSNLPREGREIFRRMESVSLSTKPEDQALSRFFANVAQTASREVPAPVSEISSYNGTDYKPFALYIFGLREWSAARFDNAAKFFKAFVENTPTGDWDWINQYKATAKRYLEDYEAFPGLMEEIRTARTPEQRTTALSKVEFVRSNLQLSGKLPEFLSQQEQNLQRSIAKTPAKGPTPIPFSGLRDLALRQVRDFQPEQARKLTEEAQLSGADQEARSALVKRIGYISEFKKGLIKDLNSNGYNGVIMKRGGATISGKITKADDFRIYIQSGDKSSSLEWINLPPEGISAIAAAMIQSRSGDKPNTADINRIWLLGAFDAVSQRRNEALPRLMRAASYKKEYAYDLWLFD